MEQQQQDIILKSITIENFKAFGAPVTIPFNATTMLFGENSADKDTALEVMVYFQALLTQGLHPEKVEDFGGEFVFGSFADVVYEHNTRNTITIAIEFDFSESNMNEKSEPSYQLAQIYNQPILTGKVQMSITYGRGRPEIWLNGEPVLGCDLEDGNFWLETNSQLVRKKFLKWDHRGDDDWFTQKELEGLQPGYVTGRSLNFDLPWNDYDWKVDDDNNEVLQDFYAQGTEYNDVYATAAIPIRLVSRMLSSHLRYEEKYQARLDERNLVISELSHHIKNLNATVREPLENLRNQPGVPKHVLEDALRGTDLIRNIVNAMNLSIGGAKEDFIFDATHLDDESVSLESIIWSALFSAIPNMFDGKHFSKFLRNYFPTRDAFRDAQSAWSEASASGDHEKKVECLRQYFFDLSVEISGSPKLLFGDTKGSATKILILCQEIMMNAVKYASTIERKKREVRILASQNIETVSIIVENSCNTETRLKTAGLGHTVIKNFASILGCEPQIIKTKDRYTLSMEFDNFSHSDKGTAS